MAKLAKDYAESEYEKFRIIQERLFESDFDKNTKALEKEIKKKDEVDGKQ